jgi:hypothetical protein
VKDGLHGCLPCKNLPNGQQYQTILHLVQMVGEWTWESKGAKHIKVLGIEDKR